MKIDYCTFVINDYEAELLPLNIKSAKKFLGTEDVDYHVSVPTVDNDNIINVCNGLGVKYYSLDKYVQKTVNGAGVNQGGRDCSNRMDWMIKNCCKNKWVILTHADICMTDSVWPMLMQQCDAEVGMIGDWRIGMTIINTYAYSNCHFGFWNIVSPCVCRGGDNILRLYSLKDPFTGSGKESVDGLDLGVLTRLEMQDLGWGFIEYEYWKFYRHLGEASLHVLDGIHKENEKNERRNSIMQKMYAFIEHNKSFMGQL